MRALRYREVIKLTHFNQRSQEWLDVHVGIPTASQFHRILTPRTKKISTGATDYICELVAEWMLGTTLDDFTSDFMERGMELEPQAIKYYEAMREVTVEKVGFCTTDDGMAGCSPDGLVEDDPKDDGPGGVEVKCPAPKAHVRYLLSGKALDDKYITQVQGSMWITGLQWWDVLSFHPDLPPALIRTRRDPLWMAAFGSAMATFQDNLENAKGIMLAQGFVPDPQKPYDGPSVLDGG